MRLNDLSLKNLLNLAYKFTHYFQVGVESSRVN